MCEGFTPFAFTSVKQKMRVEFTRKHLYINRVGVKVKGEGRNCELAECAMRGRVSCHPRVGKGRRVVHFGRKGVDFGMKVVLFSSSRQGGRVRRPQGGATACRLVDGCTTPDRRRTGERDSAQQSKMTRGESVVLCFL